MTVLRPTRQKLVFWSRSFQQLSWLVLRILDSSDTVVHVRQRLLKTMIAYRNWKHVAASSVQPTRHSNVATYLRRPRGCVPHCKSSVIKFPASKFAGSILDWILEPQCGGSVVGRVDSTSDSCLEDTGSNPAEAGHCVTTVGNLFTPAVLSGAEGWLNQLTPGTAGTSVATLGKSA